MSGTSGPEMPTGPTSVDFFAPSMMFFDELKDGVLGVVANVGLIGAFVSDATSRTSFYALCISRAAVNIYVLFVFYIVSSVPASILGKSLLPSPVESAVICLAQSLYLTNQLMTLLIALNRCTAVFFPMQHMRIFRFDVTAVVAFLLLLVSVVNSFFEFQKQEERGCRFLFSKAEMSWTVRPYSCFTAGSLPEGPVYGMGIILLTINMFTFGKIVHFQYKLRSSGLVNREGNEQVRKNVALWIQTLIQDALYTIDFIFTARLSVVMLLFSAAAAPLRRRLAILCPWRRRRTRSQHNSTSPQTISHHHVTVM